MRGATVVCKCKNRSCRQEFTARVADRKRGWGLFCSKSCKAVHQERRTGQMQDYLQRRDFAERQEYEPTFSDAHLFSNEEHDCNKPFN